MQILISRKKRKVCLIRKMATVVALFALAFFSAVILRTKSALKDPTIFMPVTVGAGDMDLNPVNVHNSERHLSQSIRIQRHHRNLHFTADDERKTEYGEQEIADASSDVVQNRPSVVIEMRSDKIDADNIMNEDSVLKLNIDSAQGNSASTNETKTPSFQRNSTRSRSVISMEEKAQYSFEMTNPLHSKKVGPLPSRNAALRNTSEIPIQRLPQAIIIGVKKSGTRALLEFLRIHPDVEGTGPEPHFFDRHYHRGLDWYRSLMPKTYKGQITIEKTPGYFVTKEVPERIFAMNPDVKLLLVVRDPVIRAISDYCQAASKRPVRSFEEMALLNERKGVVNASWNAIKIGLYSKHIKKWLRIFRRDQLHLVDGHALITEPVKELTKVEEFLGLKKYIDHSHFYLNAFKGTFPCLVRKGRKHCLDERTKGRDHPTVRENVLQRLRDFYRPFNNKFYEIVGKDFGWQS